MVGRVARFLAPIAIIAVVAVVYLIVHATLDKHHPDTRHSHIHRATASTRHHRHRHHRDRPRFYVVKPGDTLSQIAATTHIPLTRLERLNPNVSPNTLQTGQRLRLRR